MDLSHCDQFNHILLNFIETLNTYSNDVDTELDVSFGYYKSVTSFGMMFDKTKVLNTFLMLLGKYRESVKVRDDKLFTETDVNEIGDGYEAMLLKPLWSDLNKLWKHLCESKKDLVWSNLDVLLDLSKKHIEQ